MRQHAKSIIIEINMAQSTQLEGLHDLYDPGKQGERSPIQLMKADDRIGTIGIPIDMKKVKGIVFTTSTGFSIYNCSAGSGNRNYGTAFINVPSY